MSIAASVKAQLVGTAGVLAPLLTGPPKVNVTYSAPARDIPRELVYGGEITGPVELAAMAGGGRVKRTEDLILQLHVRVYELGKKTTEASDARAVEIGDVIAAYLAANWTLGGLAGLTKAVVSGVDLSGWTDDEGAGSLLTLAVTCSSYLT